MVSKTLQPPRSGQFSSLPEDAKCPFSSSVVCEFQRLRAGDSMDDSGTAWGYGEYHGLQSETVFPLARIGCKADLSGASLPNLSDARASESLLIDPLSIFFIMLYILLMLFNPHIRQSFY